MRFLLLKAFSFSHSLLHTFHLSFFLFLSRSYLFFLLLFPIELYMIFKKLLPSNQMDHSFRFPVYGFKGASDGIAHHHGLSGYAGICIGDPELGDLTISEMSPEEIRAELKR